MYKRQLCYGAPVTLTHTGFRVLSLLCEAYPHAVARSALIHALWGDHPPDSDALKSHLYALRRQLELAGAPDIIVTIPQLGYRLAFANGGDV